MQEKGESNDEILKGHEVDNATVWKAVGKFQQPANIIDRKGPG